MTEKLKCKNCPSNLSSKVDEEVHARWILDGLGDGERICSNCRNYAPYTHRYAYEQYLTKRCPFCGALMDL